MSSIAPTRIDPREVCLHQLFEQQAARLPHHPAVLFHDQKLTYAELNAQANQLAHALRALGAGPEMMIPICVERSLAMTVGILGILKAGAAYVPIDPAYPTERVAFMLADTAAPIIVTQAHLQAKLPDVKAQVVTLDNDWPEIAKGSAENPNVTLDADNLAYVIYTSGSTGQPKGTMLTHANLSHYVLALQDELQITAEDRYLHLASIAFSSSRRHLMLPLANGATVVLADEEERMDPLPLFRLIKQRGVTVLDAVPSLQRHCTNTLAELDAAARTDLLDNQLRLILSASEPLLSDLPQTWMQTFKHPAHHVHMIGQTETSGIVALHHITEEEVSGQVKVVPVGRPIAHTNIYLLDENQQPVPVGEVGEMYISGAGVGRGYLNRPELTEEKFIGWSESSSQFTVRGSQRMQEKTANCEPRTANSLPPTAHRPPLTNHRLCRTGDYARLLPDGNLECLGRQDFQVKLRGFRVELGEIEALLTNHHDVRECVVIAREDVPGRKRLVAYIVTRSQQAGTISELRALARQELPDYMVPSAFIRLAILPLTPNGKTDRRALPVPDELSYETAENYLAPRNLTEEIIAAIWAEVLGIKRVGILADFFALGGHSLLASQVIARIRAAYKIEIPLRAIFEAPTVAGLAEKVAQYLQTKSGDTQLILANFKRPDELPLSFAQQRLWFLDQLEPDTATYNLSKIIRLHGKLNADVLHQALQIMVARHEILRTSFASSNGQPYQVIVPSIQLALPLSDLSKLPAEAQAAAAERITIAMSEAPFDLTRSPLLRVGLIRLREEEHQLVFVFHHIISDGWSVNVWLKELGTLYQACADGNSSPLPELPLQYADYAAWQQQWLQGEVLDEQLSYWTQHLATAPALLELPTDKPRPAVQEYHGAQISVFLPATLRDELKALSQREGTTLFMTLLAAFQVLLLRYSGQEQIVTGTPIAGRTRLETENLIGFFVNTLALRGDLSGNPTFQELLQRTREAALGAYSHQELPFEKLVEKLQPERSLSYAPIFQVMFAMQNTPSAEMQWGSLRLTPIKPASTTAKFDLSLDVYEKEDGLEVWLEYDTALFEAATAERMLTHLQTLLAGISANPLTQIQALPLLTAQEEQQMLLDWNQSTIDVPALFVHQLFAQQAEQNPMAIAVTFEDQRITYRALNARANQVAHYLQQIGVGPEIIVGVCVERSIEMVIGLLGILKAGGAYLPLDPNYPRERLTHMLNDAGVNVLLTQQRLADILPPHNAQVIYLDTDWQNIAQESEAAPITKLTSENLAYVIYTSGSTGQPKGVMVTHGNVSNAAAAWEAAYHTSALQSHLQMASFSFDVFTGDLVRALCSGAKLVLCPTEYLLEPERLYRLLRTEAVDAAEFVPAVIRPLIQYLQTTNQRLDFMRLLVVGSDIWQREEYRQLRKLCGKETHVINSYGVTEATIDSTFFAATALAGEGMIPIGKPFSNTQLYILDQYKNPVPIGVSGELYIGGQGITRGYLNRPELTAEKFIGWSESSSQFTVRGSQRMQEKTANCELRIANSLPTTDHRPPTTDHRLYRTGDLARALPDGTIELLGRVDTQVKLRGYRIELGEIEALIRRYPSSKDCAVIVREDEPGNQRLVAYLVTEKPIVNRELQTYLKSQVPEYMVPAAFVSLDHLPLTPNGKVDRKRLPLPDDARPQLSDSFVAPRTVTEESVANIWAGLLRLEEVGSNDNFFDLGGHSLLAIRVNARLQDTFGIRLSLRSIFECPTVATLAAAIDEALTSVATDEDLAALLREIEEMSDDEAQHLLADLVC